MANTNSGIDSILTKLRQVYPGNKRFMRISEEAYQRLKRNSERYGDRESFSEIIIILLDFYEQRK